MSLADDYTARSLASQLVLTTVRKVGSCFPIAMFTGFAPAARAGTVSIYRGNLAVMTV